MASKTFVDEVREFHDFDEKELEKHRESTTSYRGLQEAPALPKERPFNITQLLKRYREGAATKMESWRNYPEWSTSKWLDTEKSTPTREELHFWFMALTNTDRLNELRNNLTSEKTLADGTYDGKITEKDAIQRIQKFHRELQQLGSQSVADHGSIISTTLTVLLGEEGAMRAMLSVIDEFEKTGFTYSAEYYFNNLPSTSNEKTFARLQELASEAAKKIGTDDVNAFRSTLSLVIRYGLTSFDDAMMEGYFKHSSDFYYFSGIWPIYKRLPDDEQLGYFRKVRKKLGSTSLEYLFARHGFELADEFGELAGSTNGVHDSVTFVTKLHTPRVVKGMLKLSMEGERRGMAKKWLMEQGANTIAGLTPLVASRGKIREGAIEILRAYKREGHEALIVSTIDALEKAVDDRGVNSVRKEVIEWAPLTKPHFPKGKEPAWLSKMVSGCEWKKLPDWVPVAELPNVLTADHEYMLTDEQRIALVYAAKQAVDKNDLASFEEPREALDLNTTGELIWRIFDAWTIHGASKTADWAMMAIGVLGTGKEGLKLSAHLKRWPGENAYRRAQKGLDVYEMIGSDLALMTLNGIAAKVKYKSVKSAANSLIQQIAKARGLTAEQLADRIIPDCGLDDDGRREFDYGARQFSLVLDENLAPVVRDLSKDKILKNLPKPGKNDDDEMGDQARSDFRDMKKQIKEVVKTQTPRLENAMVTGRRWTADNFETLLVGHPLMRHFTQRLLWAIYEGKKKEKVVGYLRVDEEGALLDANDEPITLAATQRVGIPHPLELSREDHETWGTIFGDYEIIPPFPQLNRPVYELEDGDTEGEVITKFAKIIVKPGAIRGHIDRDGWTKGNPEDAGIIYNFYKHYEAEGITASASMSYGIYAGGASWDEDQSISGISFHKGSRGYGNTIPLANVPARLISEVLYSIGQLTATV
ncbi:MAG: DUF4132 domain-containing protein [Myxococcota bacterium]|nr:DUF4132 domain-containing protein [Myxococcota bacterium]